MKKRILEKIRLVAVISVLLITITGCKDEKIEYKQQEPMRFYTSFKIGGPARVMVFPENEEELIKTLKKINNLLEGLQRDNQEIIGKAERLVGNLSGHCSIRINSKDRLVYQIKNQTIEIKQCKGHYDDK